MSDTVTCPDCRGTGDVGGNPSYGPCERCNRTGKIPYLPTHPLSEAGTNVEVTNDRLREMLAALSDFPAAASPVYYVNVEDFRSVATELLNRRALIQPETEGGDAVALAAVQARLREMARNLLLKNTADNERSAAFHMHNALNTAAIHLGKERNDLTASPTPPPIGDGEGDLVARLRAAVDIGTRTGARGQHASNIYNLADEAVTAIEVLRAERNHHDARAFALAHDRDNCVHRAEQAEAQVSTLSRQLEEAREAHVSTASPMQVAYAALWTFQSSTPVLHQARKHLLTALGGAGSDAQRQALKWAAANLPPPMNLDDAEASICWSEVAK